MYIIINYFIKFIIINIFFTRFEDAAPEQNNEPDVF